MEERRIDKLLETKSKEVVQKSGTDVAEEKNLKALCGGHCNVPLSPSFWSERHVDASAGRAEDRQLFSHRFGNNPGEESCLVQGHATLPGYLASSD